MTCPCGLDAASHGGCMVLGDGPVPCDIMLVGEAPGEIEDQTGYPFSGPAGQELGKLLAMAGMKREEVFVTNVVHCRPPFNRVPTAAEVKSCLPYLLLELEAVDPKRIVLMGATAVHAFFKGMKLTSNLGSTKVKDGRSFIISYHPAAKLHNPRVTPSLEATFKSLAGGQVTSTTDISKYIAVDTETQGGRFFCLGVATTGGKMATKVAVEPGREFLMVMQNSKFDLKVLRSVGIDLLDRPFEDTMLRARLLGIPAGLKELTPNLLGYSLRTLDEILGTGKKALKMEEKEDEVRAYCADDAEATLRILPLLPLPPGEEEIYRNIDLPLVPILVRLEEAGMGVDLGLLSQIKSRLEKGLEIQSERLERWGVTASKTAEIASVLKEAGWTTGRLTPKTGQPSTDESALIEAKRAYPESTEFINLILRTRGAAKLLSTYVLPFLESGGRVYPEYNQDTATGRLSSRNPNGQNLPPAIKRTVIAPPGYWLVTADASQLEMWMLALLSGDTKMLEMLAKDDFHYEMAKELFDTETPTTGQPSQRYDAKTCNFAMAFGGGPGIIAEKSGRSLEWAREMHSRYYSKFPVFMEWVRETQKVALATGKVYNYFGRPRRIHELGSSIKSVVGKGLREAINTPVQGSAVDGIKLMMIEFDPVLRAHGGRYINQEHDAFTAEVPKGEESFISQMPEMLTEMLSSYFPGARIPMKVEKGERWG